MRTIKNVIVTGPTGAIGTALCRLLAERGIRVLAVVRPDSVRAGHLKDIDGIDIIECDVSGLSGLVSLAEFSGRSELAGLSERNNEFRADAFFHFAWAGTTGAARNDMDVQVRNIQYTIDACRLAAAAGCSVFIGAGSQAEYGRVDHALAPETPCFPENGYGCAKLAAGLMSRIECEKLGIDHIWPRILSVYGPYDGASSMIMSTIGKLLTGEDPALSSGEQIWDYLYADDAAKALFALAQSGKSGEVYPLGSGSVRPLREYIEMLRDEIDPALPLGFGRIPYGEKQVMHLEADIAALKRDTGYEPQTDFHTGIRNTIDYVRRIKNG